MKTLEADMNKLPVGMTKLSFMDLFIMACLHEGLSSTEIVQIIRMDPGNVRKRLKKIVEIFGAVRQTYPFMEFRKDGKPAAHTICAVRYKRELSENGATLAKACHDSLQLILEAYEFSKRQASAELQSMESDNT